MKSRETTGEENRGEKSITKKYRLRLIKINKVINKREITV